MIDGGGTTRARVRLWGSLGVLALVGAIAGLIVSTVLPPTYTATSTSFIASQAGSTVLLVQSADFVQQAGRSYAGLVTSPRVLDPVISELGLHTSAASLAKQVTSASLSDTALIQVRVSDPSAPRSAAIANAIQTELGRQVAALSPSQEGEPQTRLTAVQVARTPERPSSPSIVFDVLLGAAGGAAVWFVAVLMQMARRRRLAGSSGAAAA